LVRFTWAADSCPWVGKLRTVLPFTNRDVIRDSAVQLGLTHQRGANGVSGVRGLAPVRSRACRESDECIAWWTEESAGVSAQLWEAALEEKERQLRLREAEIERRERAVRDARARVQAQVPPHARPCPTLLSSARALSSNPPSRIHVPAACLIRGANGAWPRKKSDAVVELNPLLTDTNG
jgi:hypothetical protein